MTASTLGQELMQAMARAEHHSDEVKELTTRTEDLSRQVEESKKGQDRLEQVLAQARLDREASEKLAKEQSQRLLELQDSLGGSQAALLGSDGKVAQLTQQLDTQRAMTDDVGKELAQARSQAAAKDGEVRKATLALDTMEQRYTVLVEEARVRTAEAKRLAVRVAEFTQQLETERWHQSQLQVQLGEATRQRDDLTLQLAELQKGRASAEAQIADLVKEQGRLRAAIREKEEEGESFSRLASAMEGVTRNMAQLKEQLDDRKAMLAQREEALLQMQATLYTTQAALTTAHSQLQALQQEAQFRAASLEQAQAELTKLRSER